MTSGRELREGIGEVAVKQKIQNQESLCLDLFQLKTFGELRSESLLSLSGGVSYHKAPIASSVYLVSSSEQEGVVQSHLGASKLSSPLFLFAGSALGFCVFGFLAFEGSTSSFKHSTTRDDC